MKKPGVKSLTSCKHLVPHCARQVLKAPLTSCTLLHLTTEETLIFDTRIYLYASEEALGRALKEKYLEHPDVTYTFVEGVGDQAYSSVDPYSAAMFDNILEQRRFASTLGNAEIQITAQCKDNSPNFNAAYANWLEKALASN